MQHLKFISLDEQCGTDIPHLLNRLTLPALEQLEVESSLQNPSCIVSFLQRSRAPLQTLICHDSVRLDNDALANILAVTPQIQTLEVNANHCFTDSLVIQLTHRDGVIPLAPSLHILRLHSALPCNPALFVEMIQSRQQDLRPTLGYVNLRESVPFTDTDRQQLETCIRRGLEFWNGADKIGQGQLS